MTLKKKRWHKFGAKRVQTHISIPDDRESQLSNDGVGQFSWVDADDRFDEVVELLIREEFLRCLQG
uniref:Uncharacterized protein n=1 Tax=viral metagenome TaxID=1070528 RepID=A0A6H1ZCU6_9ZZZZ